MEAPWSEFAFAVDVSDFNETRRQAVATYTSIFQQSRVRLLALHGAEDQYLGRLLGIAYRRDL